MQEHNLDNKLITGIERLSEVLKKLLWEKAKKRGLSPIQIQIMIFLKSHKKTLRTVSYLAHEFNLTKPTISDAVKVLVSKGYLQRELSGEDARSHILQLTADGQKLVKETESFADPLNRLFSKIDQSTKEIVYKEISSIIYELHKQGIVSVQRMCFGCTFYRKDETGHYCQFINKSLSDKEIRLDCDDYQIAV